MKKRTIAKVTLSIAIIGAVVLTGNAIAKASADTATAAFAAPKQATEQTIFVEETVATEPETTETTESTEATESIVLTTEATEPETTVPQETVPATTAPAEETTPATQSTESNKTTEPEATVPATEPVVVVDKSTEGTEETQATTEPTVEETVPETTAPAHVHSYTTTVVAATCCSEGFSINVCECGHSYNSDTTAKTAHNYTEQVVSATTESEGYTLHVCPDCGDSYKDNYTPVIVEVVVVEENANCCPGTDGHNHQVINRGPYTFEYCEGITDMYQDGNVFYMPWHMHQ